MADPTLDIAAFREMFPQFASVVQFPDGMITLQWTIATSYLGKYSNCIYDDLDQQQSALYLMLAHLLTIQANIASGSTGGGGPITGATVDKVSVTMAAPTNKSDFAFWLNQTPYGQQLLALLGIVGAGGFYIGGSPERAAFRRVGGGFGPLGRW
jgi:hypothetical protein